MKKIIFALLFCIACNTGVSVEEIDMRCVNNVDPVFEEIQASYNIGTPEAGYTDGARTPYPFYLSPEVQKKIRLREFQYGTRCTVCLYDHACTGEQYIIEGVMMNGKDNKSILCMNLDNRVCPEQFNGADTSHMQIGQVF